MSSPNDLITKTNLILNSLPSLKQFYSQNNMLTPSQPMQRNRERPSLLRFRHIIKTNPRLTPKNVIKPPSSGEDSDKEDPKDFTPSLYEVAKNITDYNTIMIIQDTKCFPKEATPSLLFINIDDWVNEKYIKIYLENVPTFQSLQQKLILSKITFFIWNKKRCAWIRFESLLQCRTIADFYYHPIKKVYRTKNSKGDYLDVYMCFDLLEITKSKWYGVIIRNLPPNSNDESIRQYCESFVRNGVKYCINPVVLRSIYCCIIVMNSLEDAENLCMKLNGFEPSKGRRIKVHFHPKICRIRKYYDISQFSMMFNHEGYVFEDVIEESSNAAEKAISLGKMFESKKQGYKVMKEEIGGNDINVMNKQKENDNEGSEIKKENENGSLFKNIPNKSGSNNNIDSNNTNNNNQQIISGGNTNNNFMAWYHKKMSHSTTISNETQINKQNNNNNTNVHSKNNNDEHIQMTSSPHELGEIISTTPDTKTSPTPQINEIVHTISHKNTDNNLSEMQVDYSQSEIDYYTYDMKDKAYYDSYKERMDLLRDDRFKRLLQVSKEKIKRNLTKENNLLSKKEQIIPTVNVTSNTPSKPINLSTKTYYSEDKGRQYNKYQMTFNASYQKERDYRKERDYQRNYHKDFREPRDYREYKDIRSGGAYYKEFYHYKEERHDKDYISRSSNNTKHYYKKEKDYYNDNNNNERRRSRSRSRKRERDRDRPYINNNNTYINNNSNSNNRNNKYYNMNVYHSRSRSNSQK